MKALSIRDAALRSALGHAKAKDQRDPPLRDAERVEAEIEMLHGHPGYWHAKAAVWDARDRRDNDGESEANEQVQAIVPRLEEVVLRWAECW